MTNFEVHPSIADGYKNKLKGKIFKLLPLREEKGQWLKFLDTLLMELYGLYDQYESINYISLIAKLNFLRYANFYYYRKTILECIGLVEDLQM